MRKSAEELRASLALALSEPAVVATANEYEGVMAALRTARCEGAPESAVEALRFAAHAANRRAHRALLDAYARHGV